MHITSLAQLALGIPWPHAGTQNRLKMKGALYLSTPTAWLDKHLYPSPLDTQNRLTMIDALYSSTPTAWPDTHCVTFPSWHPEYSDNYILLYAGGNSYQITIICMYTWNTNLVCTKFSRVQWWQSCMVVGSKFKPPSPLHDMLCHLWSGNYLVGGPHQQDRSRNHISRALYLLRCFRKYLSDSAIHTLVHVHITSMLDFCNSLLFSGLSNHLIKWLQGVHQGMAMLVCGLWKYNDITPISEKLYWKPVQ